MAPKRCRLTASHIATRIDIRLADKLSNHFTVTVQVPDPAGNSYFTPEFASDADVAQQIQDAIRNQQTNVQVHDQLAQDNSIGVGATLDSSHAMVPSVRVHSTAGTNDDDYQVRNYKIDINASQDIKLGNQPITFAIVHSRPGVDLTPASGLNSYAKDQASADQENEVSATGSIADQSSFTVNYVYQDAHNQVLTLTAKAVM